jgi:hypothetical protein
MNLTSDAPGPDIFACWEAQPDRIECLASGLAFLAVMLMASKRSPGFMRLWLGGAGRNGLGRDALSSIDPGNPVPGRSLMTKSWENSAPGGNQQRRRHQQQPRLRG